MQGALRALLASGLGLAASFLVACGGGSSLLASSDANKLNSDLQQIGSAVDAKRCGAASSAVSAFSNDISSLPGDLNASLRKDLNDGATNITDLVGRTCQATATTPTTPTATTATTTTATRSAPTTTTTHTAPPPRTTSTPATTPTQSGTTSTPSSGGVAPGGASSGGSGVGAGGQGQQ